MASRGNPPLFDETHGVTSGNQQSNSLSASPPAPFSPRCEGYLFEEIESLKAEIKFLKAQLKSHENHQPPSSPLPAPLQRSASLTVKPDLLVACKRSGPGFSSMPKDRTHGSLKRHPSDAAVQSSDSPNNEDIDKHESGRGLKHRKLQSLRTNENREYFDSETTSLKLAVVPLSLHLNDSTESNELGVNTYLKGVTETGTNHRTQYSFFAAVSDRAGWLVGLLILQSMSSFIISRNEKLLQQHLVIVRFLTMLVGAGGNAGNQASVGTW